MGLRGDADRVVVQVETALALAQQLRHPMSEMFALVHAAVIYQFRRQPSRVLYFAEEAIQLALEQGFSYFLSAATILRGWATAASGDVSAGLPQMEKGLAAYQATGAELNVPYFLTLVANGHWQLNQFEAGLRLVADALHRVQQTGECWWEAELHRLEGEFLLQKGEQAAAEARLQKAVIVSRQRGTKALELRASVSLGRHWQRQGNPLEAQRVVEPLCQELTEGVETLDLKEAHELLNACTVDENL